MNTTPSPSLPPAEELLKQLAVFNQQVNEFLTKSPMALSLDLKLDNLSLFTATFTNLHKILVVDLPLHRVQHLTAHLDHITQQLAINATWHLLSGPLTEQEMTGDIISHLTLAIHHLLNATAHHHFVIPQSLINLKLPNHSDYRARQLTWYRHTRVALPQLIKHLLDLGYRRHRQAIEPGIFIVRGEQIILQHPVHSGHYTITLYGPNLEKIEHDNGSRRQVVDKIIIPPLSFSSARASLNVLTSPFLIIRPAHVELSGTATIAYDSLRPAMAFPSITLPKNLQLPATHPHPRRLSISRSLALITQLQENKPVVHSDHGIGIYEGMKKRTINNYTKDYLILRYAAGDTLSVPVEYAYKVSPYLGDTTPIIHRLGGTIWQKSRRHAQRNAIAFARELLKNEASRQQAARSPYYLDPALDDWLNKSFPYELTPDQAAAWQDIREELANPLPMDRLVIGDVGFGKTELAVRAACHAVNNQQQVAILAPTTILVQQHFDLFINRLPHLKQQIASLSRFSTSAERQAIRQRLAAGELNIVIGTHALLSQHTRWQNLGLVIIDEEQRFGVAHKEHFKTIRSRLDILSLTATPIPRTLSMALSNLKQLSVINTAPPGRKSVVTWVGKDNDTVIQQALHRELSRQGQAYVIAPKVRQLTALAHRLAQLVPSARLATLHGQMPSQQIASTMQQFDHRQIDILVSSSIIANGLDLPFANTIIVTHATYFGLADLYQLRGRIGRRQQQGYALFLYHQSELTSIQRQRLTALTEASRLGSGWSLARRDLEIRGAGNLLGEQQSGSVNAVGVQLYLDMVHDAIDRTSGGQLLRQDINIQLPVDTHIPTAYVQELTQRTFFYQKLARSRTLEDLTDNFNQIVGQFGPAPEPLANLYRLLQIQHLAAIHHVHQIDARLITPAHQPSFYRVVISFHRLPPTISSVQLPDQWSVSTNNLILSTPAITPATLQQIIIMLNTLD